MDSKIRVELRPKNNTRKEKRKVLLLRVVVGETEEDSIKATGMLHLLFRADIELLSIYSPERERRGDRFGSGSSVRGTSTNGIAFVLMLSSSKGTEAFFIADTGSDGDRAS
jgi:hypothetical protein